MSTVIGFSTDDVLNGTEFNDSLEGRGGSDTLHGLAGNDRLIGDDEGTAVTGSGVLMNNLGGMAGFGENSLPPNDDGSTGFLDLSSIFPSGLNFFGTTYTGLYLNNNGNVSFADASGQFTPSALTANTGNPVIAPFFADVYTQGSTGT